MIRTIRKLAFPRPEGALEKARAFSFGNNVESLPLSNPERDALRRIAETADIIDARMNGGYVLPRHWLLVPASPDLIDFLATFESEREDVGGHDSDSEPEETDNDACDDEATDDEPREVPVTALASVPPRYLRRQQRRRT